MIPYLKRAALVAVIGDNALLAAERLAIEAAAGGRRCLQFGECVWVPPTRFARILREASTWSGGAISIACPLPDRAEPIMAMADLVCFAPSGTGNRVWLVKSADAFSVGLPPFSYAECSLLTQALLAGTATMRPDGHLSFRTDRAGARLLGQLLDAGARTLVR